MRGMIFIDGTWLWHNTMSLRTTHDFKMDLCKLPVVIMNYVALRDEKEMTNNGIILCASVPKNVHVDDEYLVEKRYNFFEMLMNKCGYEVELYEIDFRGNYLRKQDRIDDQSDWQPKEKCVDIALACNTFLYIEQYDSAIMVIGDKDFLPALEKLYVLQKDIEIVSFRQSCSQQLIDFLYSKYGKQPIWLDELLDNLSQ